MLLSYIAKRGSIPIGRNLGSKTIRSTRSFSIYSSTSAKSGGNSSKSFGTSASTPTPSSTSSSAATNYDNSIHSLKNYDVAVAYQPKDREESNLFKKKNNNKRSPALESPTGEDNLFVSKQFDDGYITLGVADGVGGWSEAGYDSSAISRELCASMKSKFESLTDRSNLSPKQLLTFAFEEITNSSKVEIGGTTACLGILTPDKKLKVANLGDSWCGLFRNYQLINETNFQTHNFNTPYQLAKIPRQIVRQAEIEGRRYIIDSPSMADEYEWDLQKGDVIMFATDGVTDNVIPKDIEIFLKDQIEGQGDSLKNVANSFVKEVVKVSKDPNFPSAFAQELSRLTGQKYLGGKADDITIVLVRVQ